MEIDRTIGFADCSQTEVVGPAGEYPVKFLYHCLRIQSGRITSGLVADCATDTLHSLLGWRRAQIDSVPPHRVAPPERIAQKVKLFLRQITDPRLLLVHR